MVYNSSLHTVSFPGEAVLQVQTVTFAARKFESPIKLWECQLPSHDNYESNCHVAGMPIPLQMPHTHHTHTHTRAHTHTHTYTHTTHMHTLTHTRTHTHHAHAHTYTHSPEKVRQEAGPDVIWRHGWCCMIAFLSCLIFTLPIVRPILRPCLSLPMLVPQGYSALFVSILSGESKELITMMKAFGYSGEKASGIISIGLV